MQDELRIFGEEIAVQCTSVKEQLEAFKVRADPLTGYNLKDAVQSLCVCLPAHTQTFRSTLSPEDLARTISEEEFLQGLRPRRHRQVRGRTDALDVRRRMPQAFQEGWHRYLAVLLMHE